MRALVRTSPQRHFNQMSSPQRDLHPPHDTLAVCRPFELVMLSLHLTDPSRLLHLEWLQPQSHGWRRWHRRWLCPRGTPGSRLTPLQCAIPLLLSTLGPSDIPRDAVCHPPCGREIPRCRGPRALRSCLPKLICSCMDPLRWTRKCGLVAKLLDALIARTRIPRNPKNHCPRLTKTMRPRASSSLCRVHCERYSALKGTTILLQYGY